MSEEYTPLRISTIKPHKTIPFNLYIFFKDRFLKYIESGNEIAEEHFTKLKKQKVARFYITADEEPNYQKFLDEMLNETLNDPNASTEEKVTVAEGAAGTAVERMQKDPESRASFNMTENAAKSLRKIIEENPDALKAIFGKKASQADIVIKHSLNVCALAVKLGKKQGLTDDELDDLGTAALIHDLGVTKFEADDLKLFMKPRKDFSADDSKKYKEHCTNVSTLLKDKPYVNKNIIQLVEHHEEKLSGDGPLGVKKLTKAEEILSLVNVYDKRVLCYMMTPEEALKDISVDELGNYSLELINSFKEVIKKEGLLNLEVTEEFS